jgi:type I restriction enzyme S subunit
MSTDKNKLIPELRFPEFVEDGEWEEKSFEELFEIGNGRDYKHLGKGEIPVYGSGGYMLSVNDYLYDGESVCIGRKGTINKPLFLVGKFWTVDTLFYTHSFKECSPKYIHYVFQNIDWLKHNEAGGVPSLSKTNIYKIETLISSPQEQQKIASCLSSLDEVIAAHSQKLATLKDHKKGLMQNLFPTNSITNDELEITNVPNYRFPEFLEDGDWEEKKLGDIAENLDSKRIPITSNQREKGETPYYGASGIIDFVKDYIYNDELLCISEDGANLVDRNYPIAFTIRGKTWVNNHAHVLKFENPRTHILVEKYINSINVEPFLTGAAQPKLNRGKLDIVPIPLPKNPKEQQKIASCLSSLDDLITAQTEKIAQLKLHKKGLMQGLFPRSITN